MSDNTKISGVPPLSEATFGSWVRVIRGYCMQHVLVKFLETSTPPTEAAALQTYEERQTRTAGILHQHMGDENYIRLKAV
ncbi:hypothetical protein Pst134EA_015035 [Puccinia striiformis f. sp. tritici]|uniref:hypothetical protein n=1 Tax=Puccinia striiformis f. sp. tritici TaxID=168172 RepID=UPI002007A85D|nr:hypothetical protein Pst134EA_015035 [Puccinia striiformis f. sp. tritici]KAH9452203.1 hypothetical protein Pst134EB_016159 [Puccinia striiformis f. sp. tritici]KAH9462951.1 hypothetical protein Pst134EA_015035 [Puccinia striiformis f. sp. tritici]